MSAGENTTDNVRLENPRSAVVARLSAELVRSLDRRAGKGPMLPAGIALNVNFPDEPEGARWKLSRIGTCNAMRLSFSDNLARTATPEMAASARARGFALPELPGVSVAMNPDPPRGDQQDDESVVYRTHIAVSVMQVAYDHQPTARRWLRRHLRGFLTE